MCVFFPFLNLFSDGPIHKTLFLSTDAVVSPGIADKLIILQTVEANKEKENPIFLSFIHHVMLVFMCHIRLVLIDYLYSSKENCYITPCHY